VNTVHGLGVAGGRTGSSIGVVPSCRTSRGGSNAAENENKGGPSLPNRDDDCASLKVFDTFRRKERARGGEPIIDLGSMPGALQA
jgi:hypothetical protein